MFGFGRKIKVNQIPEEKVESKKKPEAAQLQRIIKPEKEEHDTEIKSYKQLEKQLERLYAVSAMSIYTYEYKQDFIKPKRIYGIELSRLSIEDYISLKSQMIMRNAIGFEDTPMYRARYISKYRANDREYLVVLSSTHFEGFSVSGLINIPVLIQNAIANIER